MARLGTAPDAPEGPNFLSYQAGLTVMLAVAVTGAPDCRTARELIGLHPSHPSDLEPVTAAICQLARQLDDNGTPIDYARRRRLPRLAQAREHLARLRLIEMLTGTHPRYLPAPLQLPATRTQRYSSFTLTMPEQLDLCLRRQASSLLSKAGIDEPVTWEPPPGWITGIPWPGPDPDSIAASDLHPLIRARLPASAIAARLATATDHVLLAATRNPAPRLPATRRGQRGRDPA
jgi:hypothetical protein